LAGSSKKITPISTFHWIGSLRRSAQSQNKDK
jgi:hypothetical protein